MDESRELTEKELNTAFQNYASNLSIDFNQFLLSWTKKFEEEKCYLLVGAIIARQVSIALLITQHLTLCTPNLAPIYLRCMLESLIKLGWIQKNPLQRIKQIIASDIAGSKELIDAVKQSAENQGMENLDTSAVKEWLNEKNLAASEQSNKSIPDVYKMAKSLGSDMEKLYYEYFIALSSCLHSSWDHVSRYNLIRNPNPLHRYHFIPTLEDLNFSLDFSFLAAKFCHQSFRAVDGANKNNASQMAYSKLLTELDLADTLKDW